MFDHIEFKVAKLDPSAHFYAPGARIKKIAALLLASLALSASAAATDDRATVAALDTAYQAAVKNNDAAAMDKILADDFVLVTGNGKTFKKADLISEARTADNRYEHQEDTQQTVRVWLDTAVVTALLWVKGRDTDQSFDYKLWFSDVYVRTPAGWRYAFGQASQHVPAP